MNVIPEISIDLTAQELSQELNEPEPVIPIEVDDICEFEPLIDPHRVANNDAAPQVTQPYDPFRDDDTIEIELSAEQIDAVLSGGRIR